MQFSSQQTLTNPNTEALLLFLPTFNYVLVPDLVSIMMTMLKFSTVSSGY
jgi:hypothetical protein